MGVDSLSVEVGRRSTCVGGVSAIDGARAPTCRRCCTGVWNPDDLCLCQAETTCVLCQASSPIVQQKRGLVGIMCVVVVTPRHVPCCDSTHKSTMFLWTAPTGDDASLNSRLFQKKVWRQLRMWARRARRAVFNRALADYNADRPRWFHYSASVEPDHGSHDPHFKYAPNWSWERQLTSRLSSPT